MTLPRWLIALVALIVLGYAVPYLLLPGVEAWSGAFLFWIVFGVLVWAILVGRIMAWRVDALPGRRDAP